MKIHLHATLAIANSLPHKTKRLRHRRGRVCLALLFLRAKLPQSIIKVGRDIRCSTRGNKPRNEICRDEERNEFLCKSVVHRERFTSARPTEYLFFAGKRGQLARPDLPDSHSNPATLRSVLAFGRIGEESAIERSQLGYHPN